MAPPDSTQRTARPLPIAFINATLALCCWLVMIPWSAILRRRAPQGINDYLMAGSTRDGG